MTNVLLEKKGPYAVATIHRPEALNALNSEVLADLDAAVDDVIADDSASAISLVKAAVNAGADMDIDIGKNIELGYMAACFGTPDQIEGFNSFKEKRAAKFR